MMEEFQKGVVYEIFWDDVGSREGQVITYKGYKFLINRCHQTLPLYYCVLCQKEGK